MQAEWNFAVCIALVCFFIFAIAFARLEKFIYGNADLHIGPPDFWVFKLAYHIPMAIMFLAFALCCDLLIINQFGRFFGVVLFIPSALMIEDMAYYIKNAFDKPDTSESITDALGFVGKVPVVWIVLFLWSCFVVRWRIF